MTYSAYETSTHDGSPVELYLFNYSPSKWAYTNALTSITHDGTTYTPKPVIRSDISLSDSTDKNDITITLPEGIDIGELWKLTSPSGVISVTVFRGHITDTDNEFITLWKGRVKLVKWVDRTLEMNCESIMTSFRRSGLRLHFQEMCPYVLYGSRCKVSELNYKTVTTVNGISGNVLTVTAASGQPDPYYAGGFVSWTNSDTFATERRSIKSHVGSQLTLSAVTEGLIVGQSISIYAGCDRTLSTCNSKFSNSDNYGGFPFIPTINPFGANSVF